MNVFHLKPSQELRFQVGEEPVKLELRRGLAEVYGTEILSNKTYVFQRNSKAAVFTYQGATVEVTGAPSKCHVGQKCDYMTCYLEIHSSLEKMRESAQNLVNEQTGSLEENHDKTPICIICKSSDARNVGKSTLCQILLNYAARRGWAPVFVDLDPDQGQVGLPGTIGALSIESPIDIETGLSLQSSMLLHIGHTNLSGDTEGKSGCLYRAMVDNLARIVHSKLAQDKKSFCSGVIINTPDDSDYELLVHASRAFKANMVLVMDDEVLQDDLRNDLDGTVVLNTPKAVEISNRALETNVDLRYNRIRQYFYGSLHKALHPKTCELKFSSIKQLIYRTGNPIMLPDSLMPLGSKARQDRARVTPFECTANHLLHHILAISYSKLEEVQSDPECLLRTNVMGFICITSVRSDGDVIRVLTPQQLPSPMHHVMLYSEVQYMDSMI